MKQEAWIKQLRDRLADHEEAAPADLWAGIEAKLAQQAAPKRPRIVPLWGRWAAAAAVMAEVQKADDHQSVSEPEPAESGIAAKSQQFVAQLKQVASAVEKMVLPVTASEDQTNPTQELQAEKQLAELLEQKTEEQPVEQPTPQQNASEHKTTAKKQLPPSEDDVIKELDRKIAMAAKVSSNGVVMNPSMAANYNLNNYRSAGTRADDNEDIYLANYEEKQKHYQPISFGLSANIPIYPKLSIGTGLVYTRLRSDFTSVMPGNSILTEQTLHYIGIPVNLQYMIWSKGGFSFYAAAGGQADYNVKANAKREGIKVEQERDRLQFSVQGSLGVQFNIVPMLGIYVEPGVKYYFDNGSDVRNYFKDKPTNFNFQVGLRLNLGNQ